MYNALPPIKTHYKDIPYVKITTVEIQQALEYWGMCLFSQAWEA